MSETARKFMALGTKSQCLTAEKMALEIKDVIFEHSGTIPLALAIGVLRVVEHELMEGGGDE